MPPDKELLLGIRGGLGRRNNIVGLKLFRVEHKFIESKPTKNWLQSCLERISKSGTCCIRGREEILELMATGVNY